ncbi:E3 ubiquitin-protein ligase Jade-2 isoform X3 [Antechinus flavipes]|uniref:E3 ubiquitin-protein ligase Jade-2 isoform X3 n=1 Tax=Antechinus flavipes TaxID=38775 RepID=UPI00223580AA|nr:E3 ubiquitin-protein ligase Jade-2 isoform X3 [Antechinus flavipes]
MCSKTHIQLVIEPGWPYLPTPLIEKMEEKRRKYSISSDNSDTTDSHITSNSRCSKIPTNKPSWPKQKEKKPSEVFRTDLITAMKIPDSYQLSPDEYYILADPWRQEWEKGVQVPAGTEAIPEPVVRVLPLLEHTLGQISLSSPSGSELSEVTRSYSRYDLDEIDAYWLELVNLELKEMEKPELDEMTMERVLEELETLCHQNMNMAIETEEGLGIEYDEDVVCDVCRSPEGEDGNEMVFCDKCNVCVHQACYGILKVPTGSWLCRTCALGVQPRCLLCPKRGGALKPTRSGTKWVHVSCALWIPEVSIGCPEKMEPITKISHIPASRWALSCSLCRECMGTCIQVRNLCYMVTRREKMKHSICKLQEQIFHLQMRLIEKDLYREQPGKRSKGKKNDSKWKGRDSRKASPEKKEKMKPSNELVLGQLGLSTSFPIDGTFFNSWLAQSVQITTENMAMSEWSLNNGHHEDNTSGLLSEELLQDEETLLSIMMDHSLKSPFKHSDPTKKVPSKARPANKKKVPGDGLSSLLSDHPEDSGQRTSPPEHTMKPLNHDSGNSKTTHGATRISIDRKGASGEVRKTPKRGSSHHSPSPKAHDPNVLAGSRSSPHEDRETVGATPLETNSLFQVPGSLGSPKTVGRFRLPKEGKETRKLPHPKPEAMNRPSKGERPKVTLHFDNETDGYFSDAEMSDSDSEPGSGRVQLSQKDSGNEEVVRMSVLAS